MRYDWDLNWIIIQYLIVITCYLWILSKYLMTVNKINLKKSDRFHVALILSLGGEYSNMGMDGMSRSDVC